MERIINKTILVLEHIEFNTLTNILLIDLPRQIKEYSSLEKTPSYKILTDCGYSDKWITENMEHFREESV